jgi:hypothetical protein
MVAGLLVDIHIIELLDTGYHGVLRLQALILVRIESFERIDDAVLHLLC